MPSFLQTIQDIHKLYVCFLTTELKFISATNLQHGAILNKVCLLIGCCIASSASARVCFCLDFESDKCLMLMSDCSCFKTKHTYVHFVLFMYSSDKCGN